MQEVLEDKIDLDISLVIGRVLVPQVLTLAIDTLRVASSSLLAALCGP